MPEFAHLGIGRWMLPLPGAVWRRQIAAAAAGIARDHAKWMTPEHRRVHHACVRELVGAGGGLGLSRIAAAAGVGAERTRSILDDLERKLTFLVRDEEGLVTWAFPVTVENTPHHLSFHTGERLDAA